MKNQIGINLFPTVYTQMKYTKKENIDTEQQNKKKALLWNC